MMYRPEPIEPERWIARLAPVLAVGMAIFFTAWGGWALFESFQEPEPKRYHSSYGSIISGVVVEHCEDGEVLTWDGDNQQAFYCSGGVE